MKAKLSPPPAPAKVPPSGRRWKIALAVAAAALLALIGLAPWIAMRVVLPTALASVNGKLHGSVAYETVSLGWTTPLSLGRVRAVDQDGQTLAEVAELRTELSLWNLIRSRSQLGTLTIERPKLAVRVKADSTNLEEFLQPLFDEPPSAEPLTVAWQVHEGQIEFLEAASGQVLSTLNVERVAGRFERGSASSLELDLAAVAQAGTRTGRIELALKTAEDAEQHRGGELTASLREFPLEALQPLWPRLQTPLTLVGVCNGRFEGTIQRENWGEITWRELRATQLSLHAPELLGDDTIACEQLTSAGGFRWDRQEWHASLDAESDYGTTRLRADSVAAGRASVSTRLFAGGDVELDADLDLARLARSLPRTLRLRDRVSIEAGRAKLHVKSQAGAAETQWTASLATSDFEADHDGTRIVWRSPLAAQLAARWSREHWQIDELQCQSEFLNARLEGTADEATVRLDADLEKLAGRLSEFFALPAEVRGHIEGQLHWQRHPPDVAAEAVLNIKDFACNIPTRPAWQEPAMVLTLQAKARQDTEGGWSELQELRTELTAEPDRLLATLQQPLSLTRRAAGVAFDLHCRGELSSWQRRLGPLLPGAGTSASGSLDVKGQALVADDVIRLNDLNGEVLDLVVRGPTLEINEPRITLNLQGELDLARQQLMSKHAEVASSVVAFRADDLQVSWAESTSAGSAAPLAPTGSIQFRSDLSRLRTWFPRVSSATPAWATSGELVGRATLADPILLEGEIRQFQMFEEARATAQAVSTAAPTRTLLWEEPLVSFVARGQWDPAGEARLEQLQIDATGVRLAAKGKLADLRSTPQLQLDGSLAYDWNTYSGKLQRLLGTSFAVEGQRSDPFQLKGLLTSDHSSLIPPSFQGQAVVGWDAIAYQGVEVGQGSTEAALQDAVLKISAVDIPLSGGRLRAQPQIDLRGAAPLLTLPPGVLLDQVQISPEMCRSWLKYIAPLVANSTRAQGTFSMQVDRLQVPLGHPERSDVAGALVVQQAAIGPGPLAQTIISLVDRLTAIAERRVPRLAELSGDTWLQMPAQVVAFEVQEGRVLHRELRMQIKDVSVITRGWVAVDQSMELTLEIPIPAKWVDNNRLLAGLRGKTLTVPVRGTLAKPEIDERILTELSKSLLGNAAEKLLEDQLRRGLDRLFRP